MLVGVAAVTPSRPDVREAREWIDSLRRVSLRDSAHADVRANAAHRSGKSDRLHRLPSRRWML